MSDPYYLDREFKRVDYSLTALKKGEYEGCTFVNCNFLNADLSEIIFAECSFNDCDLSAVNIKKTVLRELDFHNCKLLGLQFKDCNDFLFSANFNDSRLDLSSFYGLNLRYCRFRSCSLKKVDFAGSDLSSVVLDQCDLAGALFENSILEVTDFRTAYNFNIDPDTNRIKNASFSREGLGGLLHKYQIKIN